MRYDLADLVMRSQQLLAEVADGDEGHGGASRLEAMAVRARDEAVRTFSFEAQMDSFVWSLLKASNKS